MSSLWRDAVLQLVLLPEGSGGGGRGEERRRRHQNRRIHTARSEVRRERGGGTPTV